MSETTTLFRPTGKKELALIQESGYHEYWIPAEDLDEFNHTIVGKIEVIAAFTDPDAEQQSC